MSEVYRAPGWTHRRMQREVAPPCAGRGWVCLFFFFHYDKMEISAPQKRKLGPESPNFPLTEGETAQLSVQFQAQGPCCGDWGAADKRIRSSRLFYLFPWGRNCQPLTSIF